MVKSTRGERLRQARKERLKGMSGREAAEALGVKVATLNAHETGTRNYKPDEAEAYAKRLGVRPEWLLFGRGAPAATDQDEEERQELRIPIIGYVGENSRIHFYSVARSQLDDAEPPKNPTDKTVGLEILGSTIGPRKWIVFYDEVREPLAPTLIGQVCVAGIAGDEMYVGEVRATKSPGLFNIGPVGSESVKNARVTWAAIVRLIGPK